MIKTYGKLLVPEGYESPLSLMESQRAIKKIKDYFQQELAYGLKLRRVSAPIFVDPKTGLNDNLNGVERRVSFTLKDMDELQVEVVQSLAKWKRYALGRYGVEPGYGIYTDMNALRRDEELDNLHSVYVDQWDWEKVITRDQRNEEYLKETVITIYDGIKNLGDYVNRLYRDVRTEIPNEITFVTTQELEDRYPDLTPKEREDAACREYGAIFLMKIGGALRSGKKHDGRSPDYDDWELNGDIILWNDLLERSFEISSMGIRVDAEAMARQLELADCMDRAELPYQKAVLNDELPLTIGGGIGQSRLCMFFLRKAHIGEVQVSVWPEEQARHCEENNIHLL
jgi:aspartate--ammonia ligase